MRRADARGTGGRRLALTDHVTENFFWFLPTNGDSRSIFGASHASTHHEGVLIPTGTWGEPPSAAAEKIERVRALAEKRGRSVRFGIRLHTISRDTSAAAWAVAEELVGKLTPEQIAKATELHSKSQSEGQRRMTALHGGRIDQLEIYPYLWAGVGWSVAGRPPRSSCCRCCGRRESPRPVAGWAQIVIR